MKNLSTNEIRRIWVDFWKEKEHFELESKSLIPHNDNSLLFINSGVATLKNYLSGKENPPAKRIVNSQKSLRTNDIENVGVTSRHHTMFEMLGNFSIGDYFKKEAITYGWELLTSPKYYDLDKEKLYITVHPSDIDSYNYWIALGVEESKIIKTEENFWEIGKGPGGPNTEIFFDRGESYDKRSPVELIQDDLETDRVIEIWNIVFSQYNCDPEIDRKDYKELPQKNIDTGMGLERMACVIQGVETNFETDNFKTIMDSISKITNTKYKNNKKAYRIIADHVRSLTFAISDGVDPSNEGRGYVIRRILRRAVKYAYIDLETKEPFLYQLIDSVIDQMKEYYPELMQNEQIIKDVVLREEKRFLQTINDGVKHYNEYVENLKGDIISGEVVFKLYDTYGFPLELTQELAQEKDLNIDFDKYSTLLEEQKQRARDARKNIVAIDSQNNFLKEIEIESEFIGYENLETNSKIIMITDGSEELQSRLSGTKCFLIFDKTPFYATSGGQEFDLGKSESFNVTNVIKLPNGQHLHEVDLIKDIKVGDRVNLKVDQIRRNKIQKYHSSTHLLHYALNKVLGDNIKQAGSSQDDTRTRFDYTAHQAPTKEELIKVQKIVNDCIKKKILVNTKLMSLEEAKKHGAKALFDSKYGKEVRVVTIGESIELCGGTHVKSTEEIEKFIIVSEQSVGSGIRRIEALTSSDVDNYIKELKEEFLKELQCVKKGLSESKLVKVDRLNSSFKKMLELSEVIEIEEIPNYGVIEEIDIQLEQLKAKIDNEQNQGIQKIVDELIELKKLDENDIQLVEKIIEGLDNKILKDLADKVMEKIKSGIVIIGAINDDKISMVVKVSDDLVPKYHAGKILKEKLIPFEGRGGGKPTIAQGGGLIK